jgi:hypothetical protein
MRFTNIFLLLTTAVLFGCASTPPVVSTRYGADQEASARNFIVSKDVGRIYFSAGKVVGGMYEVDLKNAPAGLYINSALVGQVNYGETMAFDVKPGTYIVTNGYGSNMGKNQTTVSISGGEIVFLRGDTRMGSGSGFGLIGAAISSASGERTGLEVNLIDRSSITQPLNIVSPQNCPPSVCVAGLSIGQVQGQPLPAPVAASSPTQKQNSQSATPSQRLKDLNELRKNGLITNADYESKKASILKEM